MNASRRDALRLGLLALALPGLPAFVAGAPAAATARIPGVAEVWGLAFWSHDAGEAPLGPAPGPERSARAVIPPEWHPEFA